MLERGATEKRSAIKTIDDGTVGCRGLVTAIWG
jgi:hypothetical protein